MRTRHFRHPALALMGAVLFLFLGISSAQGMNRCAHHATTHSDVDAVAPAEVEATPADHAPLHHHGKHADASPGHPDESRDDDQESSPHGCDCGVFCVGMTGPPPVEPGAVRLFFTCVTPTTEVLLPGSGEDLEPICRIPYLLPFPNAPPLPPCSGFPLPGTPFHTSVLILRG